jgi:hypothetical protein
MLIKYEMPKEWGDDKDEHWSRRVCKN